MHQVDSSTISGATARVLDALQQQSEGFISGAALAAMLGVSRAAVWKQIEALRALGYDIEARRRRGYRLREPADRLDAVAILAGLGTHTFGRSLACHLEVGSTMDEAARAAAAGAPEGHLVISERQRQGRGRYRRAFFCPPGGLWFSLVLRPPLSPALVAPLSLIASIAVAEGIRAATGLVPELKWPNDLRLEGRKISGILLQVDGEADLVHALILGIGINVNISPARFPPELAAIATSLAAVLGRRVDRAALLQHVLRRLEERYRQFLAAGPASGLAAWRSWPNMLGRRVRVTGSGPDLVGCAADLDADGALVLVDDAQRRHRVIAGDLWLEPEEGDA